MPQLRARMRQTGVERVRWFWAWSSSSSGSACD